MPLKGRATGRPKGRTGRPSGRPSRQEARIRRLKSQRVGGRAPEGDLTSFKKADPTSARRN